MSRNTDHKDDVRRCELQNRKQMKNIYKKKRKRKKEDRRHTYCIQNIINYY